MDFMNGGNGCGDDHEESSNSQKGKKQYHRHSPEQIQQLEAFFRECPHPDENQRRQLSKELGLEPKQIKFWFQNKRTQTKTQNERADNNALRTENENILRENLVMREALKNLICPTCDGTTNFGQEERQRNLQKLRSENAWLKKELERFTHMVSIFVGKSSPQSHVNLLSPTIGSPSLSNLPDQENHLGQGIMGVRSFDIEHSSQTSMHPPSPYQLRGMEKTENFLRVETIPNSMDEPICIKSSTDGRFVLQHESYDKLYPQDNQL